MKIKTDILVPVSAIIVAEAFLFLKYTQYGISLHVITLLVLVLAAVRTSDKKISNMLQVLALLPVFRLINITMPIFLTTTLYFFAFVYGPLFIPLYFVAKSQKFSGREIGMSFEKFHLYFPVSIVLGLALGTIEYNIIHAQSLIIAPTFQNFIVFAVIMVMFVGLAEELLFRSILQTRLEQTVGSISGLIIASLLFGAMHSGYGSLYEILFTFSAGFFLGYLFQKTRSLPFITFAHGLINVFLFALIPMGLVY